MDKKKTGGIILLCVLGVIAFIFLYLIGFFDSENSQPQNTDNNITTVSEITNVSQSNRPEITEADTESVTEGTVETSAEITEADTVSVTEGAVEATVEITEANVTEPPQETEYKFRNKNLLNQHYEKHGKDMGFSSAEEYEKAASKVVNDPNALHKTEAEDGDDIYYIVATNEFVVVSTDGYIRTYFLPDRGIDYYNKQ